MKKRRESDKYKPLALFRTLLYFPPILFISSLARGIWYYRLLPDVVPPLIPVLWPFSVPLPRFFYLLLPFTAGVVLYASDIWGRKAGTHQFGAGDKLPSEELPSLEDSSSRLRPEEAVSLESDPVRGRKVIVERIRQGLSHPTVVSYLLQVIAVSLYAYVQEIFISHIAEKTNYSSFLAYVYGGILALALSIFLFSIIIRMYRKNHRLS